MNTKIYPTIKSLNILFIKLQFSITYNQAFRPLRTSSSNIYINLSLNPNGLVIFIIANIFISSLIYLMIPDMHPQRFLPPIKLGPGLQTYQAWGPLVYPPESLCYFCLYFNVHKRWSWCAHKGKVLTTSCKTFIHTATKGYLRVIYFMLG